jgi:hypothetical protein
MFEVLSVENTDENCEFRSFSLVFGSPCKFPFSFRGAISEFSHFLFLMKVKSFLFLESWLEDIMHDPEGECIMPSHLGTYFGI